MSKKQIQEYLITFIFSLFIFAFFVYYNYLQLSTLSPRVYNRALADTSIITLGLALSLGMLSRLYKFWDKYLTYRKELGVLAFFAGAAHVYLTMFPLARHGTWGFYHYKPLSAYTGLAGLIIMFFLLTISFQAIEKSLGTKTWWKLQYIGGRLAGLTVLTHILIFRGPDWLKLLFTHSPQLPPSSFLVGTFALFVLTSRLTELLSKKLAKFLIPFLAILSLYIIYTS